MHSNAEQLALILNSGSSSLKFAFYTTDHALQLRFRGSMTEIGTRSHFQIEDHLGKLILDQAIDITDHEQAFRALLDWVANNDNAIEMIIAGHRIVHGGSRYHEHVQVTAEVLDYLESLVPLAPNHQPANLLGITTLQALQPGLTQVACFDTVYHHSRPEVEQYFALPRLPMLDAVHRYGFHGLSYEYIAKRLADMHEIDANKKVIVAHLGHGASLCAMQTYRSVATTMTFTPLDGIPMGTRCGSIDPAVVLYLQQQGMSLNEVSDLLYFKSGLLGVSGVSGDMAILLEQQTPPAQLAVEQFIHHCVRAIGSLAATLEGLDVLVFCGGIGENAVTIRESICQRCAWLGLELDMDANQSSQARISQPGSAVQAWVLATNEEYMIAEHTMRIFNRANKEIAI